MENSRKYKVSVKCCTYNQAQYVTDALNGFVMQETDFPFVCCIIDDASTDGEQEVIREYVTVNFDMSEQDVAYEKEIDDAYITYARHKSNKNCFFAVLYLKRNLYRDGQKKNALVSEWMGNAEYIALCEGDDYWIDEKKLAEQVKLMDNNSELGMCYTQYLTNNKNVEVCGGPYTELKQLIFYNSIGTLTVCLRANEYYKYVKDIQPLGKRWKMGDYPIWLYMAAESKIGFINNPTAIYRVLSESASHSASLDNRLAFEDSVFDIRNFFNLRYNLGVEKKLEREHLSRRLIQIALKGSFLSFCRAYAEGIKADYRNLLIGKNYCYLVYSLTRFFIRKS